MILPSPERLEAAYQTALASLLAERDPEGHWTGELSTSALSTATAVSALSLVRKHSASPAAPGHLIAGGLAWLAGHQNADGGWGDTVVSLSNISTTMLARAAFHLAGAADRYADCLRRSEAHLRERFGPTAEEQVQAVRARYGKDRTFAVPILATSALAGLVKWDEVQSLPFELACFPQSWFRFLRLPVVSYALPALIALGQAVYRHRPPLEPVTRLVRRLAIRKSLRVLEIIQPSSGGFLEAVPLTSFVTLSLASIGLAGHPVARKAVEFLVNAVRPDGSWPIDSNLATWVTTLAVNALATAGELGNLDRLENVHDWLRRQQYMERHPYTGAEPGAFAWTPLPGGVPDADDTPGAIIALCNLERCSKLRDELVSHPEGSSRGGGRISNASGSAGRIGNPSYQNGVAVLPGDNPSSGECLEFARAWVLALQNRDGGWPTFCRGWGTLPFDRSGTDLTAHNIRALIRLSSFKNQFERGEVNRLCDTAVERGLRYLARSQRPNGSWVPLWFGNQYAPAEENPTYGTARVVAAYRDLDMMNTTPARRGIAWLLSAQNPDGGWGGDAGVSSSVEETALAVEVLLDAGPEAEPAVSKGLAWLVEAVEAGGLHRPTPIGFYFAKLWYFEKLYPMIFTVGALGRARLKLAGRRELDLHKSLP